MLAGRFVLLSHIDPSNGRLLLLEVKTPHVFLLQFDTKTPSLFFAARLNPLDALRYFSLFAVPLHAIN